MSLKPDIKELFNRAFGIKPVSFDLPSSSNTHSPIYGNIPVKEQENSSRMSWLGTPIINPVMFKGGKYNKHKPNGSGVELVAMNDWYLPPASLIDFSRSKIMSKTRIAGNNGTIKEIYGFTDWSIKIRGLCLDTPNESASEQYKELLKWEDLADSIDVIGKLFVDKSIYKISIEEIDFKQLEGSPNIIPFTINVISDVPLETL